MSISFKKFTEEDVPLYYEWAENPHVKNVWFLEGYQPKEYILQKIAGNGIEYPFVILINDRPIGHIQYWDIYARDQIEKDKKDYFTGEPEGTYGIDLFIGEEEYLGKGYGTKELLSFTKLLFEQYGAKKIVIDPSLDNKRAIRSYEKAGFHLVRLSEDEISGETMLMELLKPL